MRKILSVLALFTFVCASKIYAEPLYEYGGKKYTKEGLPPNLKQAVYEVDVQLYKHLKGMFESNAVRQYIEDEAKRAKVSFETMEAKLIKEKPVSDADAKKWFEENQHLIGGRQFDTIKEDIKRVLKMKQKEFAQKELLALAEKKGGFKLLLKEPKAPQVSIATNGFPSKGQKNGKVQIIEFADYKCPHCKHAAEALKDLMKKYSSKVELVFIDFPIDRSGISTLIAEGAVCADEQKKYWDYHYLAFDKQAELSKESPEAFAKELKLDLAGFKKCMASSKPKARVEDAKKEGERIGVNGTPAIFINGRRHFGYDLADMEKTLKTLL